MTCRELDSVVGPYLDAELVDTERVAIEGHLATCDACRLRVEIERANLGLVRTVAREGQPQAPAALRERIHASLGTELSRTRRRRLMSLSAAAASVAVVSMLGVHEYRSFQRQLYDDDATLRHARHFPLEIKQLSPEALESWFNGKLDHRVSVPRLPNATATGARILNVRERQAAYIRYDAPRRNGSEPGQVGLFVYGDKPRDVNVGGLPDAEVGSSNGYNVVSWRDGDVVYQLVTDLDEGDIRTLLPSDQALGAAPVAPAINVRPVSLER